MPTQRESVVVGSYFVVGVSLSDSQQENKLLPLPPSGSFSGRAGQSHHDGVLRGYGVL